MKKYLFIPVLVLIISMSFLFTACNNATPQGQLGDYWCNYEHFAYTVTDKTDKDNPVLGNYFLTIQKMDKGDTVTLASDFVLNNVENGNFITSSLDINGVTIETACYFQISNSNNFLVPQASWRKVVDANSTTITTMHYSSNNCAYKIVTNGVEKSGEIGCSSPYYDTNEIYNTLRGASTMTTGFSMTFNVALPAENTSASVNATCSGTTSLTKPEGIESTLYGEGIDSYVVSLSRSTTVAGVGYTLYYGMAQMTVSNWKITRPLIKIVEGNVEYDLTSISVTPIV